MVRTPNLETERLLLRTFTEDDTKDVFECWESDPDVSRYMCWESHNDINRTRSFISREISKIQDEQWFRWAIVCKESNQLIGTCLIYFNEDEDCWDMAYNLGKRYWGKGYTTEAMKVALKFAIETLGVHEFASCHAVENPASGRVMQKLGFQFDKEIEYICNGGKIKTIGKRYILRV